MKTILPIASGKGGVGKTVFSANLGVALAEQGKTVILIDLDLGSSNLHTCLGIKNRYAGIGSYIYKKEPSLESLLIETSVNRLFFIPGDSLLPGTANLPFFMKRKLLQEIQNLVADFIIIDLGAGTFFNVIDFFLISYTGLLVTTAETTAILSAYSFLKTSVFRLLFRSFQSKSREREIIGDFIAQRIEGTNDSFNTLVEKLSEYDLNAGAHARDQLNKFYPRIIINQGRNSQDLVIGSKLRHIAKKNIGISMEYIGFLGYDPLISRSIIERRPYLSINPGAPFSKNMITIAKKIVAAPVPEQMRLFEANEDLMELAETQVDAAQLEESRAMESGQPESGAFTESGYADTGESEE